MEVPKRNFLTFSIIAVFSLIVSAARAEESEPQLISLYQYKPIYFLMGTPDTKIQISFKVQLVRNLPIYFAYSQLMFWELFQGSPYFKDLNYNPEVFYRLFVQADQDKWIDLGPLEHESNGKGGALERSWNRTYVRYHTRTSLGDKAKILWNLKAWVPIQYNSNNKNLAQYRGIWEVDATLTDFLGPFFDLGDLEFRFYPGGESLMNPLRGGQELTFRAKSAHRTFMPLFVAQIFHGYAENLLDYQETRWGIRAGLGF